MRLGRIAWVALTACLCAGAAYALSPTEIFRRWAPSVVVVEVFDPRSGEAWQGSGVVVESQRVVTNCHVADKGTFAQVIYGTVRLRASLVEGDRRLDLCLLAVPGLALTPVRLRSSKDLLPGEQVFAIGAPLGLPSTLSNGLISGLRTEDGVTYIQTSAPISQGSSGGALFDESGLLIGITIGGMKGGQNLNFALPVDWVDKTLQAEAKRHEQELRRAEQQLREKERQLQEEQQRLENRAREAAAEQARAVQDAANAAADALKREESAGRVLEAELKAQKEEVARLQQQLRSGHPEMMTAFPSNLEAPASPNSSAIDADLGAAPSSEEEQRSQEARQANELRMEQEAETRRLAILDEQQKLAEMMKARADKAEYERALDEAALAKRKELAQFVDRIKQKIRSRVIVPSGINGNPEAVYSVTLLPGGEVLDVKLVKSSGMPDYDAAVERAIRAADPLPVPSDPDLFQKLRGAKYVFRPIE